MNHQGCALPQMEGIEGGGRLVLVEGSGSFVQDTRTTRSSVSHASSHHHHHHHHPATAAVERLLSSEVTPIDLHDEPHAGHRRVSAPAALNKGMVATTFGTTDLFDVLHDNAAAGPHKSSGGSEGNNGSELGFPEITWTDHDLTRSSATPTQHANDSQRMRSVTTHDFRQCHSTRNQEMMIIN